MAISTLMRRLVLLALLPTAVLAADPPPQSSPKPHAGAQALVTAGLEQAVPSSDVLMAQSPLPGKPPVANGEDRKDMPSEGARPAHGAVDSAGRTAAAIGDPLSSSTAGSAPGLRVQYHDGAGTHPEETALALRIVLGLTLLALVPAILVSLTGFLRIIIVLSMLRHALGMQETPPNTVLLGLALFLTIFAMSPVVQQVNQNAFQPFMNGTIGMEAAYETGIKPVRTFMLRQTREQDLALMVELAKAPQPSTVDDISNVQLVPAFMLSELRTAFQIGFVIFLPFLLIDLIVSSILMGLGMMMVPPASISLPLKILMFVLVDGWSLVLKSLVGSFH